MRAWRWKRAGSLCIEMSRILNFFGCAKWDYFALLMEPIYVNWLHEHKLLIRKDKLRERLIYENYPELLHLNTQAQKNSYLNDLVSSYLLKDILAFEQIKNSDKIVSLLRLLAFQVGSLVSTTEIGKQLGIITWLTPTPPAQHSTSFFQRRSLPVQPCCYAMRWARCCHFR